MSLIHKLEPLFWLIFGAGGYLGALVFPGLFLGVLVFGGFGLMSLDYATIHGLASGGFAKLVLYVLLITGFWHCAHHLRHLILDLGGHAAAAPGALISYLLAIVATVWTVTTLGAL